MSTPGNSTARRDPARTSERISERLLERQARDVMTMHPVTIASSTLAAEALHVLEQRKITSVVVTNADQRIEGVVHLHDLWRTELI